MINFFFEMEAADPRWGCILVYFMLWAAKPVVG